MSAFGGYYYEWKGISLGQINSIEPNSSDEKKIAEGNVQNLSSWQGWVEAKNNFEHKHIFTQTHNLKEDFFKEAAWRLLLTL